MKKHLLKTLLTALVLLTGWGINSWAAAGDVATNADIDFSKSIVTALETPKNSIIGNVGIMTWDDQWTMVPNVTDGILQFGNFSGGVVELQNNNIRQKDVVTISFDMAFGKLNGKHVGFELRDAEDNSLLTQWFDAYNGDFDDANPLNLDWSKMYRGSNTVIQERCVNFVIKIDYAGKTITTTTKCLMSGSGKPATDGEFTASWTTTTPISKFVLTGNINNAERYSTLDNLKITTTEGDYSAATAKYTVKYLCGESEIKDAKEYEGDINAAVILTSADKANCFNSDESTRYIYVGDDSESKTIAADGSTEVTVNFRNAEMYDYSVKATFNGDYLSYLDFGSVWEDLNSATVSWPRYIDYNKVLYERAPVSNSLQQTITIPNGSYEIELPYSATEIDDLYRFREAENLGTTLSTSATSFPERVSGGQIIFGASGDLLTLPAGTYKFTLGVIGGDNSSHIVNYVLYKGELTEANKIAEGTCTGNFLTLIHSEEFTLTEETAISFTCSDPSSSRGIDLIYVQGAVDPLAYAKAQLQKAIEAAKEMNTDGLSEDEIGWLNEQIGICENLLADDTATPEDLQRKAAEFNSMVVSLNAKAEQARVIAKQDLYTFIGEAESIETEGKNGADELATAIADAKAVLNSSESKYQDYIDAKSALAEAVEAFEAANAPFDPNSLIVNADFEGEYSVSSNPKDDRAIYKPEGWTVSYSNGDENDMTALNSNCLAWNNFSGKTQPTNGDNNTYWIRFRWGNSENLTLSQTVTMPAGSYRLSADAFFNGANGGTASISAAGQTKNISGNSTWSNNYVDFTLEEKTEVTISFGLKQTKAVENIAAFDNFMIQDLLPAAKEELTAEIAKAEALKTEERTDGIEDFNSAISAAKAALVLTTIAEITEAVSALQAAETTFLTANLPVAEGTYYVINPMTGKFLGRGNAWGTSAVVGDYGVAVNVACVNLPDGKYTLTNFDNGITFGDDTWMFADASGNRARSYIINKVDGGYTMTNTGNNQLVYVYLNDGGDKYRVAGNANKGDNYTDDAQTVWDFITPDEYNSLIAARNASEKTAAFESAGIDKNAELMEGESVELTFTTGHSWTQTVVRAQDNQPATNANGTEMWQATGYYTQTVSELPSGLYKVSIQAFYRNGSPEECVTRYNTGYNTVLAYLDANGSKVQVKSWATDKGNGNDPNTMDQAKAKFADKKYISETYAYVGEDGKLNLAVYNPAHIGNGWFIAGNVTYTPISPATTVTLAVTDAQYATFVAPFDVTIPDGVTAYTVDAITDNELTMTAVETTIVANTPVVLFSETVVEEEVSGVANPVETPTAGLLTGVYTDTPAIEGTYILQKQDAVAFFKVETAGITTVKANHAYLTAPASGARAYYFGGEATAIGALKALTGGDAEIYDVNGRKQVKLQKGVNIIRTKDGRTQKVMVK